MLSRHQAATVFLAAPTLTTVVVLFLVSILLQGCKNNPKECEGSQGKDLDMCKKCVEHAQKTADSSLKAVELKACGEVAKESNKNQATATTKAPSVNNNVQTQENNQKPSVQQATTTPKVQVNNPTQQLEKPKGTDQTKGNEVKKTVDPVEATQDLQGQPKAADKLVICDKPCVSSGLQAKRPPKKEEPAHKLPEIASGLFGTIKGIFGNLQVADNSVDSSDKATLAVASSAIQLSAPIELPANSHSTGIFISARARRKMAEQARNGASKGWENPYSLIEIQPATNTAQVRSSAIAGQDIPYSVIESQSATNAA